jgi:hypothetical protein
MPDTVEVTRERAVISLFSAGDNPYMRRPSIPRRSGHRPLRLALLLLAVLAAVLAVRGIVVVVVNGDRVTAGDVEGLRFHGRYHPVEKVCLVVDDADLEDGLDGDAALAREGLLATGNGFIVNTVGRQYVSMDCGWRNWEYDTDPRVFFLFSADVYTERVGWLPACGAAPPAAGAAPAVPARLGRYASCRRDDGFEVVDRVIDDNAVVECAVKAVDESLVPALAEAMREECEDFIDRLARSRPVPYVGNGFWTVR